MACKFIKNARAAAIEEGLDPSKIGCTAGQGECVDGQGCATMQDFLEDPSVQKRMFAFAPREVHPKLPVDSFYSRLEAHDNIWRQGCGNGRERIQ